MPAVSVIFAFHRETPFLEPALRSVLAQTFPDFEVLLVDDGTGRGLAAAGGCAADPRLRLIPVPERRGIVHAHNTAVAAARGEFIALMDYDDLCHRERFARQVAALRARPELGLVGCHARRIDGEGRDLGPAFTLVAEREQRIFSAYTMPATSPTYLGWTEMFRRYPMREEFPFSGDFDVLSRVVEARPVVALPDALYHYREHAGQTTRERKLRQEWSVSLSRLLAARRRAGRPEDLAGAVAACALRPDDTLADVYLRFGARCLEENFPLLAVYHARKAFSVRRDRRTLSAASSLFARAWRNAQAERGQLARMFLIGPLRTHGLKPQR